MELFPGKVESFPGKVESFPGKVDLLPGNEILNSWKSGIVSWKSGIVSSFPGNVSWIPPRFSKKRFLETNVHIMPLGPSIYPHAASGILAEPWMNPYLRVGEPFTER